MYGQLSHKYGQSWLVMVSTACWCGLSRSQLDSLGPLFAELVTDLGAGLGTELLKLVLYQILGELGAVFLAKRNT